MNTLQGYGYPSKVAKGQLTVTEKWEIVPESLDTTDIAVRLEAPARFNKLRVSNSYVGIVAREGRLIASEITVTDVASDSIVLWKGGNFIHELGIRDTVPYIYTRKNHKDCLQAYYLNTEDYSKPDDAVFDGLYIGKFSAYIRGQGKAVIAFTEFAENRNLNLFSGGIDVDTDSEIPYFFLATNLCNSVLGSPENPIDGERISGKTIRVLDPTAKKGKKGRAPLSHNSVIHYYADSMPEPVLPNTPHSILAIPYPRVSLAERLELAKAILQ